MESVNTNHPLYWHTYSNGSGRYKRGFFVKEFFMGMNPEGFVVSIEPNESGVTPIYICHCDDKESADVICGLLNDELQRNVIFLLESD